MTIISQNEHKSILLQNCLKICLKKCIIICLFLGNTKYLLIKLFLGTGRHFEIWNIFLIK